MAVFGELCARCGNVRTPKEFEGLPICEDCKLTIQAHREDKRACPHCESQMRKLIVLNVVVDKCPGCQGAWLDAGELELMQSAIESGAGSDFAISLIMGMAIG